MPLSGRIPIGFSVARPLHITDASSTSIGMFELRREQMMIRKISLTALAIAALAASATDVSAQARGFERAAATAAVDAGAKSMAAKNPKSMPAGIMKVFGDGPVPPGIARTRPASEPPTPPEAEDGPDAGGGGVCDGGVMIDENGFPVPC
jgi:hypothetical protein